MHEDTELWTCASSQLTYSEVLADAPVTGLMEFQFPDAAIERKAVLEQFLSLVSCGTLDTDKLHLIDGKCGPWAMDVFDHLHTFLHKYDCSAVSDDFKASVLNLFPDIFWGWQGYVLGAFWGIDKLCAASLNVHATSDWSGGKIRYLRMEHVEQCDMWQQVHPRYEFALRRVEYEVERWFEISLPPLEKTFRFALWEHDASPMHHSHMHGDVTLISSDRWKFKVHSHVLLAAGFVMGYPDYTFEDEEMVLKPTRDWQDEIHFSDFRTESKAVIEQFLSLAINSKLLTPNGYGEWHEHEPLQTEDLDLYFNTISFMCKHNCSTTLATFGAQLIPLMSYGVLSPQIGFGLGVLINDRNVCATSLTYYNPSEGRFRGREALPHFPIQCGESIFLKGLDHVTAYANGQGSFDSTRVFYKKLEYYEALGYWTSDSDCEDDAEESEKEYYTPAPPEPKRKYLAKCFLAFVYDEESESA